MPVILALDTSGAYCSVALAVDGTMHVDSQRMNRQHNLHVLGSVDGLCRAAGIVARDVDGIAFVKGPGSFTGVRLAVSVTQGLALGAGARVLGVTTSVALALHARKLGMHRCVTLVPSRADAWYVAAFERPASISPHVPCQVVADQLVTSMPDWLADFPVVAGGRPDWLAAEMRVLPEDEASAATVLEYACITWDTDRQPGREPVAWTDAGSALPVYVEGDHPWQPAHPV